MAKVSEKQRKDAYISLFLSAPQMYDKAKIVQGIKLLAGHCDGARSWDGAGFGKFDVEFGHKLADAADNGLSTKQLAYAAWFCTKYHGQLEQAGIIGGVNDLLTQEAN